MVCTVVSRLFEDIAVDCVVGSTVVVSLGFYKFVEAGVEIVEAMFGVMVGIRVLCICPRSEAAYWGVSRCKYDVREYFPVHHSIGAGVCFIIVGDSRV
jgi:hypothetical protein